MVYKKVILDFRKCYRSSVLDVQDLRKVVSVYVFENQVCKQLLTKDVVQGHSPLISYVKDVGGLSPL